MKLCISPHSLYSTVDLAGLPDGQLLCSVEGRTIPHSWSLQLLLTHRLVLGEGGCCCCILWCSFVLASAWSGGVRPRVLSARLLCSAFPLLFQILHYRTEAPVSLVLGNLELERPSSAHIQGTGRRDQSREEELPVFCFPLLPLSAPEGTACTSM